MPTQCRTGVGRIVWGHPLKLTKKTDQKNNVVMKDGQPVMQCAFGIAFPEAEFAAMIWPLMQSEAATVFPNGVPQNFSWKYKHHAATDRNGKLYSQREGYAGCITLNVSTELGVVACYKFENGAYRQLTEGEIKCGDFVVASLNFQANKPADITHTPGIYVNPVALELVGYGKEIQNTPDPTTLFGGQQYQLPPGASAQPISSAPIGVTMPGQPANPMQPGMAPTQPGGAMQAMPGYGAGAAAMTGPIVMNGASPSNPQAAPAPATNFIPGAPQPGQPANPMQPGQMPGIPPR